MILDSARSRPVFVKDMCYYVADRIHDDVELIRRMTSTFLVRDPAKSIPSYYRLDPAVTLEEIGCEAQYRCFERFAEVTGRTPVVVDAADLAADPAGTLRAYCRALGLAFIPEALEWDAELPQALAGRERLARRSGGLDGYHATPGGGPPGTGRRAPPPRLLRASPAVLSQAAGAPSRTRVASLMRAVSPAPTSRETFAHIALSRSPSMIGSDHEAWDRGQDRDTVIRGIIRGSRQQPEFKPW